jgi:hypothetical protein
MYNMRAKPGEPLKDPAAELAKAVQQPPIPGMAPAPGAPQAMGPQPVPVGAQNPLQVWANFLPQLEGPFLAHFFGGAEGLDGYTLAQFIQSNGTGGAINNEGRAAYMRICEAIGPRNGASVRGCGLDQLIRQYHPIWSKIQGLAGRYEAFLTEFFTYDEWCEKNQAQGEDDAFPSVVTPKGAAPAAN